MMKFYHLWCWLGGIVMGIITYTVQGAGGFFAVDGQSMKYHANTDGVVGFCLASSRICCEEDEVCADGVAACSSSATFLNAQKWYVLGGNECVCAREVRPLRTDASVLLLLFSGRGS
jgi:hypothetical protein